MRAAASAVLVLAVAACADDDAPPTFQYDVSIKLIDSITTVEADGAAVPIDELHLARITRTWPSYDEATGAAPIEVVFFEGDTATHTGHARPGSCGFVPTYFDCPASEIVHERISIDDWGHSGPSGGYLDFDVGFYTSASCEGCGGGFASVP